ncbi:MAG: HNH endonuclease [Chlorobia bacterium]|nr:HNH endonuclease [Fimbriimonadaceae bacterium]
MHHIVEESKGGPNIADNGIPLCFDCHADVKHYNAQHPRGTKYSGSELRKHKVEWFKRVAVVAPTANLAEHRQIDVRIATEIHHYMTSGGGFYFLRDHDIWASYKSSVVEGIFSLLNVSDNPDMQFFDADLETARAEFVGDLAKGMSAVSFLTSLTGNGNYSLGSSIEIDLSPRIEEIRKEVAKANDLCSEAAVSYSELFHLMRSKLGIDLRF